MIFSIVKFYNQIVILKTEIDLLRNIEYKIICLE